MQFRSALTSVPRIVASITNSIATTEPRMAFTTLASVARRACSPAGLWRAAPASALSRRRGSRRGLDDENDAGVCPARLADDEADRCSVSITASCAFDHAQGILRVDVCLVDYVG